MGRRLLRLEFLVPLAVLCGVLVVYLFDWPIIRQFQNISFDTYQRIKPRPQNYGESPVRIVDIDEESLRIYGQWPWPRTLLAQMTTRLAEAGAAAIAFDIVFAEPDRLSPGNVARVWQPSPDTAMLVARLANLPDHDALFAEAIEKAPVVTGFVVVPRGGGTPLRKVGYAVIGADPAAAVPGGEGAIVSLENLQRPAKGNGAFNWFPEEDQIIRRVPIVVRYRGELYPSLFSEALRVGQGARGYKVRSIEGALGIEQIQIGQFIIETDRAGRVLLHFAHSDPRDPKLPSRYIPAWRVLDPEAKLDEIEGRIVFVGTSAVGLFDLRATPLDAAVPGVEVHAQAIEATVTGAFLRRPDFARAVEFVFIALVGLLIIALTPRVGASWAAVVGFLGVAAAVAGAWFAFDSFHWMLDALYPALAGGVVFLASTLIVYFRSEVERRQIRGAFGRYLAPALVERLAADPSRLKLGGEMREMTILFSDIRGFTGISEKFDAAELTSFMNRYLTPMTDAILSESGTVDKYMGDAIMAFWNAPLDDPNHARHACRAALAMQDRLAAFNRELEAEAAAAGKPFAPVATGIGINSAICCVGNMGSQQRFDYSVLGDGVNLTARLEGQTKHYGVPVLVGEETLAQAPGFAALEVDLVRVKGKTAPSRIHALVGDGDAAQASWFRAWTEAQRGFLEAYRARDWDRAEAAMAIAREAGDGRLAGLYRCYGARLAEFRIKPPPDDWEGVHEAESK